MNISIKYFSDDPNKAAEGIIRSLERGEKIVYDKDNRSFAHLTDKDFNNLQGLKTTKNHYVSKIQDLKKCAEAFIKENQVDQYLSTKLYAALEHPGRGEDKHLPIYYLSNDPVTLYSEITEALSEGERILYDTSTKRFVRATEKEVSKIENFDNKRGPSYARFTSEPVIIDSLLEGFIEQHGIEPKARENLEKAFRSRAERAEKDTFLMTSKTKRRIGIIREISSTVEKASEVANKKLKGPDTER